MMLTMLRVSGALAVMMLYVAPTTALFEDLNDQWRQNNWLLQNYDEFYTLLASTTSDAKIKSKRFVSVLSCALVYYSESDYSDKLDRVREAVNKTKAILDKPADALAGSMRSYLTLLRNVIDQPINDVKASCSPATEQSKCLNNLKMYHNRDFAECSEYERNLKLYEKSRDFFTDYDFTRFLTSVKHGFDNSDEIALAFFVDMVLVEYRELVRKGRNLYRMRANTVYPCNVVNLPPF